MSSHYRAIARAADDIALMLTLKLLTKHEIESKKAQSA